MDGTFCLDVPVVLLGYNTAPPTVTSLSSATAANPLLDLSSTGHTHLQLFIALEPPLSVLPPIKDQVRYITLYQLSILGAPFNFFPQFESHEDPHMLQQASIWLKKLRSSFPARNFTVSDSYFYYQYPHPSSIPLPSHTLSRTSLFHPSSLSPWTSPPPLHTHTHFSLIPIIILDPL